MDLFPGFDTRTIGVPGAEIHCRIKGSGPPVLLLHGYPQSSALWAFVAPVLARTYTVVCADLRGYGDSSKPATTDGHLSYSFRAMADDQVSLMQTLGFSSFHIVGHDRGGRAGFRAALDHRDRVRSLALLDIVPTATVLDNVDSELAAGYWHWFYLSLPNPLPENMIALDPDFFFSQSIATWGAGSVDTFDPAVLGEYRRCWSDPEMIRASCEDYRAAVSIDIAHDRADRDRAVTCPTLIMWGTGGLMARHFDVPATWRERCPVMKTAPVDAGHFLVDERPAEVAQILLGYLNWCESGRER
jgi:haloacetate dehalogenase